MRVIWETENVSNSSDGSVMIKFIDFGKAWQAFDVHWSFNDSMNIKPMMLSVEIVEIFSGQHFIAQK